MTTERKGIHVLTADIKSAKAEGDNYDIILSVPTQDRDGEVVDAKAFEPLPEGRMPIDVDHGMTVLSTVGSGIPVYEGDLLKLTDFRWASTALGQDVRSLVDEGHISKMSVAFMDAKRVDIDGVPHVQKAELLNAAVVAVPSNREADIAYAAKAALTAIKVGARNSAKDAELIQTMHDSAASLGAACSGDTRSVGDVHVHVSGPADTKTPVITDPEETAAPAAVDPPAEVDVAKALVELSLAEADLALE